MSVTAALYGKLFLSAFGANPINWLSDSIKVMLLTNSYTPNQDTHQFKSDVVANEVSGTAYVAGGVALAGVTLTYNAGTKTIKFAASNASWAASTITAAYAVVYDATPGSDATRPLIEYQNFGGNVSSSAGTFLISWNASGIATIVVGAEA